MTTPVFLDRSLRSPKLQDSIAIVFASGSFTAGLLNIGMLGGHFALSELVRRFDSRLPGQAQ